MRWPRCRLSQKLLVPKPPQAGRACLPTGVPLAATTNSAGSAPSPGGGPGRPGGLVLGGPGLWRGSRCQLHPRGCELGSGWGHPHVPENRDAQL